MKQLIIDNRRAELGLTLNAEGGAVELMMDKTDDQMYIEK
jgi:hypothetical protein